MPNCPLVDITSLRGVESLFDGPRDPFATMLAADFADLFIFSETARYPATRSTTSPKSEKLGAIPPIVIDLAKRDPGSVREEPLFLTEEPTISDEYLQEAFENFQVYATNNADSIAAFMRLHNAPEIRVRPAYQPGVNTGWTFPAHRIVCTSKFEQLRLRLGLPVEDVCHVFDMVLKYSLYAVLVGEGEHYLAHPLRVRQTFPTMHRNAGVAPLVPFRCGPSIVRLPSLTLDEYLVILHEARGLAQDMKMKSLKRGEVERERVREFCSRLGLPPRLKPAAKKLGFAAAIASFAAAKNGLSDPASVAGGLISLATAFWDTPLPCAIGRIRWLQWALDWDAEKPTES